MNNFKKLSNPSHNFAWFRNENAFQQVTRSLMTFICTSHNISVCILSLRFWFAHSWGIEMKKGVNIWSSVNRLPFVWWVNMVQFMHAYRHMRWMSAILSIVTNCDSTGILLKTKGEIDGDRSLHHIYVNSFGYQNRIKTKTNSHSHVMKMIARK